MKDILSKTKNISFENKTIEEKLILLSARLKNAKGKKVYGYLDKATKDIVDSIVDELAKDITIADLYYLWYEKKYEILGIYSSYRPPQIPLSENNEFKSIKNDIIYEALGIHLEGTKKLFGNLNKGLNTNTSIAVSRLFKNLCGIFRDKAGEPKTEYDPKVDRRIKREDDAKRNAEILYD